MLPRTVSRTLQITLIVGLVFCGRESASAAKPEAVRFTARVRSIKSLADHSGQIVVAAVDPQFAVTGQILGVPSGSPSFAGKKTVTFAIHSPAQLLSAADRGYAVGCTFDFTLHGNREKNRVRYYHLSAAVHR